MKLGLVLTLPRVVHGRQRMYALDPQQRLQAIEQDILDDRDHLALDHRALDVAQPSEVCSLAIREDGTQIKPFAYIRISGKPLAMS